MDANNNYETRLKALVAKIDFAAIPELFAEGSDKVEVAIHQLESRNIILWGKTMETFLFAYHDEFPAKDVPLTRDELDERFEVAFDEGTQPLTRALLKTALKDQEALSLTDLAAHRYKKDTASFRKMSRHVRDKIVWPMRDLGLWSVKINERLVKGKREVESYEISAGPALLAFHRFVYMPLRRQQLLAYHNLFAVE